MAAADPSDLGLAKGGSLPLPDCSEASLPTRPKARAAKGSNVACSPIFTGGAAALEESRGGLTARAV